MILTPLQIHDTARGGGFPRGLMSIIMTALALRESGGDPSVHNGNAATSDDSYGLWQLNCFGPPAYRAKLLVAYGISDPAALLDPAINARGAFRLWNGKGENLAIAWSIYRDILLPSPANLAPLTKDQQLDQSRFESHLGAAIGAALVSTL